jgi:hypothetical protein
MEEQPDKLTVLLGHVESAIEEINLAAVAATDLDYTETALWLEWLGEELEDLIRNVLQAPSGDESWLAFEEEP